MILKGYLFSIIFGLVCIGLSGILFKLGIKAEYTRKITHILVGFEWVILYNYFGTSFHFLIVCLVFLIALFISDRTNIFPQLQSKGDNSSGVIWYCIAMSLMGIVTLLIPKMILPFGIGVFSTSLGDGFAGIFGRIKKYNKKIFGEKTLFGSVACFAFSFISAIGISHVYKLDFPIYCALLVAIFATELELFAVNGIDNLTITVGVSALSYFLAYNTSLTMNYIVPILSTIVLIAFVLKKKALTKWGIVLAVVLDIIVSIAFGNIGFVILLMFFVGSLMSDKVKKHKKRSPSEQRNSIQVLANGFVGGVSALIYIVFPNKVFFLLYATSFAEAFADTVGSGIGALAKNTYDPFRMKKVENGLSGGMSIIGTTASLLAALSIASLSLLFEGIYIFDAIIIASCGFLGSVFDSFLGSRAQIKYICRKCGAVVEDSVHCDNICQKHSGFSWVNNNVVNLVSIIVSVLLSLLLSLTLK